jgi:hypothetical protein
MPPKTVATPPTPDRRRRARRLTTPVAALTCVSIVLAGCGGGHAAHHDAGRPAATSTAAGAAEAVTRSSTQSLQGKAIRVVIGGTVLHARLRDSATAESLAARLPLVARFTAYADQEKVTHVSPGLSTAGAPRGSVPVAGDIGYYAPSQNLVFYYQPIGYFDGIVIIGPIDDSVSAIAHQHGPFGVRIERGR